MHVMAIWNSRVSARFHRGALAEGGLGVEEFMVDVVNEAEVPA
jgi:hypothetical protein